MLEIGLKATSHVEVSSNNTAIALGSGDLEVFATPAMIALMESAAAKAVAEHLPEGSTTVGTAISSSHIKASGIGAQIEARAQVTAIEGRMISFTVEAVEGDVIIGEGIHTRAIVDRAKFMQRVSGLISKS